MTKISVELVGEKKLQQALAQAAADVKNAAEIAVVGTALDLRANIVQEISKRGRGRTYTHYFYTTKNGKLAQGRKRNKPHIASAEGDPPATDTGRLKNNIYFERLGALTAAVGSDLVYATYLEYGTSKMAARPFFRPAVEKIRPIFMKRIEKALGDELR